MVVEAVASFLSLVSGLLYLPILEQVGEWVTVNITVKSEGGSSGGGGGVLVSGLLYLPILEQVGAEGLRTRLIKSTLELLPPPPRLSCGRGTSTAHPPTPTPLLPLTTL